MPTDTTLVFGRGETKFGGAPTTAPDKAQLGDVVEVVDSENGTQRRLILRAVRNGSGGSLSSATGRAVKYAAGQDGLVVDGYATSLTGPDFAGWVDEKYSGFTIASNDVFWIVERGASNKEGFTDDTIIQMPELIARRQALVVIDEDFLGGTTMPVQLTSVGSSPVVTSNDAVGGTTTFAPAATTDNAAAGVVGAKEAFLMALAKPIIMEGRIKCTEGANTGNFAFGWIDAAAAGVPLGNNGVIIATANSGCYFFKVDGGTVWQARCSSNTNMSTNTSVATFTSGAWVTLRIEWYPGSAVTSSTAKFFIDGVLVFTSANVDFTTTTESKPFCTVKAGDATNAFSVEIDRIFAAQLR